MLFQVLIEREERSAVAIASNAPFSGWTRPDAELAPDLWNKSSSLAGL